MGALYNVQFFRNLNKISLGTYIFQILTSYAEMTDTSQLWGKPIMTFILSC